MNISDDIYDLTIRYLSDEISQEEWQKLKSWVDLSDEHRKAIRDIEEVWFSAIEPDELKRFDKEALPIRISSNRPVCRTGRL